MKSKNIIKPKSLKIVLFYCLCAIIICGCICAIPVMFIESGADWLTISATVMAILVIGYFGILLWSHIIRGITVDEKGVYVQEDRGGKFIRVIQYSASVTFENVVDLWLMISTKDSRNEEKFGLFTPMTYLVIDCKDGDQQLFNLYYYNKKQISMLLDLIISKSRAVGSPIEKKSSDEILKNMYNDNYVK